MMRDYQYCSIWSDVGRLLLLLSGDIELNPGPITSFVQTNDKTVFTVKKVYFIILFCTLIKCGHYLFICYKSEFEIFTVVQSQNIAKIFLSRDIRICLIPNMTISDFFVIYQKLKVQWGFFTDKYNLKYVYTTDCSWSKRVQVKIWQEKTRKRATRAVIVPFSSFPEKEITWLNKKLRIAM